MPLSVYSNLAHSILNENCPYKTQKEIILKLFLMPNTNFNHFDLVYLRTAVINQFYATNLNMGHYRIDEMALSLCALGDDLTLREKFVNFDNDISDLFQKQFGIFSNGHTAHRAISALSKYAYFLTNYNFPIYDNLAKVSFSALRNRNFHTINTWVDSNIADFLQKMNSLNTISGINDFDKLDNLIWLYGKLVNSPNLALIVNSNVYRILQQSLNGIISKESLIDGLRNHQLDFLNTDLRNFLRFVYEIE